MDPNRDRVLQIQIRGQPSKKDVVVGEVKTRGQQDEPLGDRELHDGDFLGVERAAEDEAYEHPGWGEAEGDEEASTLSEVALLVEVCVVRGEEVGRELAVDLRNCETGKLHSLHHDQEIIAR